VDNRLSPHAANLNACFALLRVLTVLLLSKIPPKILLFGLNPIHETKWLAVFHFVISIPVSDITF